MVVLEVASLKSGVYAHRPNRVKSEPIFPVQIRFEEGTIGTPNFNDGFQFPKALGVFGQQVDISPLDTLTKPLQDAAASVARMISGQPPLKFPIRNGSNADSWLLTTYLDEDLRISRGDGGGLFVLLKEGTSLS